MKRSSQGEPRGGTESKPLSCSAQEKPCGGMESRAVPRSAQGTPTMAAVSSMFGEAHYDKIILVDVFVLPQ